ncbi:isocitrate lyase-family enzyme [Erythrobacter sp. Dej080120_24]|uniref:isocitrate lyase/PEP mutase family protein n=1 Tax=Erythrobacter sp. Dej080120_24 TaxID=3024837 RepID=UPI002922538B|nr:isocitrate lyase-family enzyme [Erythrobacter sp. Dej080120_24]
MTSFSDRLAVSPPIACPGVFDALSALLAEEAGFKGMFLSGSALSYSGLGRPDIGLVSSTELVDATARITDRVSTPLVVDADGGMGGVAHVGRLVRSLSRAGAAAVQIEDQAETKPAHALTSRPLISAEAMVGKIKAAQDARLTDECLISARTDAAVSVGFDEALRRAERYVAAGCDLLFIEGITTSEQFAEVGNRFGSELPLVHNMFKGSASPASSLAELAENGFSIGLFSGVIISTMILSAQAMLATLNTTGALASVADRMHDNAAMVETIGASAFLVRYADMG